MPSPSTIRRLSIAVLLAASWVSPLSAADDADAPAPGHKLALLIAVRQYNKNELRPLQHTENDVNGLEKALKGAGYRRVVLMTQTLGAEETRYLPTGANIRKELRGILADRREGDSVVIALSGHGVQFQGKDEHFFCPADARLADRSTLISITDLYRDLEKCGAGFKLMFVDACRNDPQSDNSKARAEVDLESVTRPQRQKPPGGLAVLFSCSQGEKSFESSQLKQGVFFHYVLKGLEGAADYNRDRRISLDELSLFVKSEVPEHVKEEFDADLRQMPELVGATRGLVPIVELAALTPDRPLPAPPAKPLATPKPLGPRPGLMKYVNEVRFRSASQNKLHNIGTAILNFEQEHKKLPAAVLMSSAGKPLLSWRVQLLKYLDEDLYKRFKLDEPWDSPHNKTLISLMPDVYKALGSEAGEGKTNYLTVRGADTPFPGTSARSLLEIQAKDGTADTVAVVEVSDAAAVTWTAPEDYPLDPKDPKKNVVGLRAYGFLTLHVDGSVRYVKADAPAQSVLNLFRMNDGNRIDASVFEQ